MLGIVKIKEALHVGITIGLKVADAWEDGKVSLGEGVGIALKAVKIWGIAKDAKEIYAEFKDLDEVEKEELIAYFVDEFDLENDSIEYIIEQAFALIIQMSDFVNDLK